LTRLIARKPASALTFREAEHHSPELKAAGSNPAGRTNLRHALITSSLMNWTAAVHVRFSEYAVAFDSSDVMTCNHHPITRRNQNAAFEVLHA
jgi:hypothetical protein